MIYQCTFESDRNSGMRVVLLPPERSVAAIATDSVPREDPIPVIDPAKAFELPRLARSFLQPNARDLREAELIRGFYEGVPFEVGKRKHEEYLQRKIERSL